MLHINQIQKLVPLLRRGFLDFPILGPPRIPLDWKAQEIQLDIYVMSKTRTAMFYQVNSLIGIDRNLLPQIRDTGRFTRSSNCNACTYFYSEKM